MTPWPAPPRTAAIMLRLTIEYLSPVSGVSFPVEFYDIGGSAGRFRDQIERSTQWQVDMPDLHLPALRMARPPRTRRSIRQKSPASSGMATAEDARRTR